MPPSSHGAETLTSPAMLTPKMKVDSLRRECARDYSNAYQKSYNWDQSDIDIKDHFEYGARPQAYTTG